MSIFLQLSAEHRGGISGDFQKDHMRQNAAVLCIGLGGTGTDAVNRLKKEVCRHFKPDHPLRAEEEYEQIRCLMIDCGLCMQEEPEKPQEYMSLSSPDFGTGGNRQAGRRLLLQNARWLRERLQSAITDLKVYPETKKPLHIYLFCGLTGGMGGGAWAEVCCLLRKILESRRISEQSQIYAYFFMPDVNLSKLKKAGCPAEPVYLKANGYEALKELDSLADTENSPADVYCLISSVASDGIITEDGYERGLRTAVEAVLASLCRIREPVPLEERCRHGHYYMIGAASAGVPVSDMAVYITAKLFEDFGSVFSLTPGKEDLDQLISGTYMSFKELTQNLSGGLFRRTITEESFWDMTKPLKDYSLEGIPSSQISHIFFWLCRCAQNPQKGPFFAQRLLSGPDNKNMLSVMDEYICRNDKNPVQLRGRDFRGEFLHILCRQIEELDQEFFQVLTAVLDTLRNTFAANLHFLTKEEGGSTCGWRIGDIAEIRRYLDETAASLDRSQILGELMTEMIRRNYRWLSGDPEKIAGQICEFITCHIATRCKWDLKDMLGPEDPAAFRNRIKNDILKKMFQDEAAPLFWLAPQFDKTQAEEGLAVFAPVNGGSETAKAAEEFASQMGGHMYEAGFEERIALVRFLTGVPLDAYGGMEELKEAYKNSTGG